MEQILEEIRELRRIVQSLQPSLPPQSICEGVTGKGTRCRNRASPGSCYCRMHTGERKGGEAASRAPKKVQKTQKKVKKVQPEHTHDGGVCMLCETHGDVWDATLVDAEFEGNLSVAQVL